MSIAARPSRRDLLKAGLGATTALAAWQRTTLLDALAACPTPAKLTDIEHVVIFIQENRSFDNYFGRYKGVRGFDDRSAPGGAAAFAQKLAKPAPPLPDTMLPFHISTALGPPHQGMCTSDVEHQWAGAHDSWNHGANDNWMNSHLATEPTPRQAALTMGYYDRSDLEFYYALADNFTICDNYFCSVIGGTDINRLYSLTGTCDPDGWDGGLQHLDTQIGPAYSVGNAKRWIPYPQTLSQAGISWKVYGTPDGQWGGDNVLRYFPQFRPGGDPALFANAFGSNTFPLDFLADCHAGTLPQVSWLVAGLADAEHPPDPLIWGESLMHTVLSALTTSQLWSKSALFFTYDENGGFFDHVPPPTAPKGTPGEYFNRAAMSAAAKQEATTRNGVDTSDQPIGLGMRVPMLVVSPFTRNPNPGSGVLVSSDRFDHTSLLRFVETWAAAKGTPAPIPDRDPSKQQPGLSHWRRRVVGDLTSAFNFAATPDASVPTALLTTNIPNRADPRVLDQCFVSGTIGTLNSHTQPIVQDPTVDPATSLPRQEPLTGPKLRPRSRCESDDELSGDAAGGANLTGDAVQAAAAGLGLPNTASNAAGTPVALLAATAAVGLLVRLRMRAQRRDG